MATNKVQCARCGTSMSVHGTVGFDDEFFCNECKVELSKPVHPALAGDAEAMKRAMAIDRNPELAKVPMMEARDKLWGSDGMFLHTMHMASDGQSYVPGMEFVDGVDEDDARRKLMNRVRACVDDPNCVRIVTGIVLTEMRRTQPEAPVNRLNGHNHSEG